MNSMANIPASVVCAGALAVVSASRAQPCQNSWDVMAPSLGSGIGTLTAVDLGFGPNLYAARVVQPPGGGYSRSVVRWTGTAWDEIASTNGSVLAFEVFDEGTGPVLFAGGNISLIAGVLSPGLARWNGARWSAVPTGWTGNTGVNALCVYDDGAGPALIVGGYFPGGVGGVASSGIGAWTGREWRGLGGGLDAFGSVGDMLVWDDDGAGPNPPSLFVGGYFDYAGPVAARRVARWDGRSWHALGAGICPEPANGPVHDLEVYDDGSGEALYAAGTFYGACGVPGTKALARWDGATWSSVAHPILIQFGTLPSVTALHVFDDGVRGPGLFAGGEFTTIGGVNAPRIARYDGAGWSSLGDGPDSGSVPGMVRFDEGPVPTLWVNAGFLVGPGQWTNLARYQYVCEPCYPDCDGSGALSVADFGCFQGKYVLGDLYADCNASGNLTVADFGCFQTKYVLGCP